MIIRKTPQPPSPAIGFPNNFHSFQLSVCVSRSDCPSSPSRSSTNGWIIFCHRNLYKSNFLASGAYLVYPPSDRERETLSIPRAQHWSRRGSRSFAIIPLDSNKLLLLLQQSNYVMYNICGRSFSPLPRSNHLTRIECIWMLNRNHSTKSNRISTHPPFYSRTTWIKLSKSPQSCPVIFGQ